MQNPQHAVLALQVGQKHVLLVLSCIMYALARDLPYSSNFCGVLIFVISWLIQQSQKIPPTKING